MSGLTSQPAMGSICSIIQKGNKDPIFEDENIANLSLYWEQVRKNYSVFETDFKGGSSEVYVHQMPGGQFTNLKEQARSLGISTDKWGKVVKIYSEVNKMFGDIIKVTPSSKVVGDMALYMIANDLSCEDVLDSNKEISFPESVISFFKGELGTPMGGFPKKLQSKVLGKNKPLKQRPGSILASIDIEEERNKLEKKYDEKIDNRKLASHLMYPKVFDDYMMHRKKFSDTSILPTSLFFYGPQPDKEYSLRIDKGKNLIVRYLAKSNTNNKGMQSVFFEINGQPRTIEIEDRVFSKTISKKIKTEDKNRYQIGSPLPGQIAKIFIKVGDRVIKGDNILVIEAMKMETTITAETSSIIKSINVETGDNVETKDLLIELE